MKNLILIPISLIVILSGIFALYFARKNHKTKQKVAEENIDSIFMKLNSLTKCLRNENKISGTVKGFPFQIIIHYNNGIPVIYWISLNGNFPKQKQFMFDYPKLGNGLIWQGDSLNKKLPINSSYEDIHLILNEMAITAQELENNIYKNSISAKAINYKSTQYIIYFLLSIVSIFLCLDIYLPSNHQIEGILENKTSSHFGGSSSYEIQLVDSNSTIHTFNVTPPTLDKLQKGQIVTVIQSPLLHRTTVVISQNKLFQQYFLQSNLIIFSVTLISIVGALGGLTISLQRLFKTIEIS